MHAYMLAGGLELGATLDDLPTCILRLIIHARGLGPFLVLLASQHGRPMRWTIDAKAVRFILDPGRSGFDSREETRRRDFPELPGRRWKTVNSDALPVGFATPVLEAQ